MLLGAWRLALSESVNSRGRRRSMWACAFQATFISSISFIYLLYSYSFSKHFQSLHRETFEGGGTESHFLFPKHVTEAMCVYYAV